MISAPAGPPGHDELLASIVEATRERLGAGVPNPAAGRAGRRRRRGRRGRGRGAGRPASPRPPPDRHPDAPTHTDDGLRAALRVRADLPGTAVLVLSQHVERRYAVELLGDRASGVGYLLKQRVAQASDFCQDVRRVGEGGTALDPEVVAMMMQAPRNREDLLTRLSPRRREVLALIAAGRTNAAIARSLTISEKSVVAHTSGIYDTLGLTPDGDDHRRVLAVVRYLAG